MDNPAEKAMKEMMSSLGKMLKKGIFEKLTEEEKTKVLRFQSLQEQQASMLESADGNLKNYLMLQMTDDPTRDVAEKAIDEMKEGMDEDFLR